jgi:hypothetical protein
MTASSRRSLRVAGLALAVLVLMSGRPWSLFAQAPEPAKGVKFAQVSEADAKQWLTYLSSDALQGRQIFKEGYGLAAAYIAEQLRTWGVKPMGEDGTYFQSVKLRDYRVTRNSSVTVEVNGESKTFKHGANVTFPTQAGGKQTLTFNAVDFAGYGLTALNAAVPYNDFGGRDLKGKLVVWLPGSPAVLTTGAGRGGRGSRSPYIVQTLGAGAVLTFAPALAPAPPSAAELALAKAQESLAAATQAVLDAQVQLRGGRLGGRGARGGRGGAQAGAPVADVTTVQRVDGLVPPQITGNEDLFTFLFSAAPTKFADLRAKAEKGEPLPPFTLSNVKITINVDNTYEVISTQLSKNVVGMVEGGDPKLKDTYVFFGAHLDHVGYREAAGGRGGRAGGAGAGGTGASEPDLIFNGADDDGSGSTGLMGIAKAFATGPRPRRSVIFVWHTGEEAGLLGSRYMADYPVVPLEKVQAQFNIDMIGRNRDDKPTEENTVYVIGADRISTDLHNVVVETNKTLPKPVTLDFEYNDPNDANSFYTRSDHYSYAAKGIPIAFFFTGTHPDYHQASDHVEKILFPKLVRIAQMVYQSGFAVANSERTLARDSKGPRSGRGFEGVIKK